MEEPVSTNIWTDKIDLITEEFRKEFGSLNIEQLNWKPNPKAWSIAQNMEHLIIINGSYFPTFQALKDGTFNVPFAGKIGFLVKLFGKFILKSVQPDNRQKAKTFPLWEPSKSKIDPDILERFTDHQSKLKEWINNLESSLENGAIISSPANKSVVYTLKTAYDIMVTHEQRHFRQAKEVLEQMENESVK